MHSSLDGVRDGDKEGVNSSTHRRCCKVYVVGAGTGWELSHVAAVHWPHASPMGTLLSQVHSCLTIPWKDRNFTSILEMSAAPDTESCSPVLYLLCPVCGGGGWGKGSWPPDIADIFLCWGLQLDCRLAETMSFGKQRLRFRNAESVNYSPFPLPLWCL